MNEKFDLTVLINNLEKNKFLKELDSNTLLFNYVSDTLDLTYAKYLKTNNLNFKNINLKHIYYFIILYKAIEYIKDHNYDKVKFLSLYFNDIILNKQEMDDIINFINIVYYINKLLFKTLNLNNQNSIYLTNYNQNSVNLKDPIKPTEINIFLAVTTNIINKLYPLLFSLTKYSLSKFNVYIMLDKEEVKPYYGYFKPFQTLKMNIKLLDSKLLFAIFKSNTLIYGSVMAYARLLIPTIFPNLDRILYLDYDIIIANKGIEWLYNIDLKDKTIACVLLLVYYFNYNLDGWFRLKLIFENIKNIYFNSGVQLFNIKNILNTKKEIEFLNLLTKNFTIENTEPLLNYYKFIKKYNITDNNKTFTYVDQSVLNYYFHDEDIIAINPIFNSLNENLFNINNLAFKLYIQKWGFENLNLYNKNIIIHHYAGGAKPWKNNTKKDTIFDFYHNKKVLTYIKIKQETDLYLKDFNYD